MMLEQRRAASAFADVTQVKNHPEKSFRDDYSTMVLKLPALVRSAGLCQALHFVKAKAAKKGALKLLLEHLGKQLGRVDASITDGESLCTFARTNRNLAQYLRLTREALATMHWYSRIVRAELDVEPGTTGDRV